MQKTIVPFLLGLSRVEVLYALYLYVVKCMTVETLKVHRSVEKLRYECEGKSS